MTGRIGVGVMSVLLAVYLVLVGWRAVQFVLTGEPVAIAIGVALIVLPLIGFWALARELGFARHSNRLVEMLDDEGGEFPADTIEHKASGRPVRAQAEEEFARWKAEAEAKPEDWRSWLRLGLAYDAAGDRKRARAAVRQAIELERRSPHA